MNRSCGCGGLAAWSDGDPGGMADNSPRPRCALRVGANPSGIGHECSRPRKISDALEKKIARKNQIHIYIERVPVTIFTSSTMRMKQPCKLCERADAQSGGSRKERR